MKLKYLWGLAAVLSSGAAMAQSFTAIVEPQVVDFGEAATLVLSLEGASPMELPTLKLPEGVSASRPSRTQSFRIIGGVQTASVDFRYVLSFEKAGDYTIGPATVRTDKGLVTSGTVKVRVRAGGELARDVLVSAELIPSRAYTGQAVVATFELAVAKEIASYDLSIPFLAERNALRIFDPEELGERWNESVQKTGQGLPGCAVLELSFPQAKAVARVSQREIDGVPYTVYSIKRVLLPQEPGRFDFGSARIAAAVVVSHRRRRDPFFDDPFFNDPFFGGSIFSRREALTRRVAASSPPLTLEVLDLPRTGRPDGFAGAVGSYELDVEATPREVVFGGSPVQLTMVIRGEGNIETVGMPRFASEQDFRTGVPEQGQRQWWEGNKLFGEKRFVVPLRPRRPDVNAIPELHLDVFDPAQEKYVSLRAGPIPIKVVMPEPSGVLETLGTPTAPGTLARSLVTRKEQPQPATRDIEDIEEDFDPSNSHAAWLHEPIGLFLFGVMPLVAFGAVQLFARRWRRLKEDATLARRLSAAKNFRARLDALESAELAPGEFASQLSRALQTYVADHTGRPPGELPAAEAESLLIQAGTGAECARQVASLLAELDAARFGGASGDRAEWLAKVRSCVENIEGRMGR